MSSTISISEQPSSVQMSSDDSKQLSQQVSDMQVSENPTPKKLVFCLPGREYSRQFLMGWTRLMLSLFQQGHEIVVSQNYSSVVHFARTLCLGGDVLAGAGQKPFQGKVEYDAIIWIDSDVLFNPQQIVDLINSPHPVTCGMYMMEDLTHFAAVKEWDTDYFGSKGTFKFLTPKEVEDWANTTQQRYMPVAYSGMGAMVIKNGVLEKLSYPWFYRKLEAIATDDGKVLVDMMSEDVALCKNLQDKGVEIMLDTKTRVGHQKLVVL